MHNSHVAEVETDIRCTCARQMVVGTGSVCVCVGGTIWTSTCKIRKL